MTVVDCMVNALQLDVDEAGSSFNDAEMWSREMQLGSKPIIGQAKRAVSDDELAT
jgi:hypothetical protein